MAKKLLVFLLVPAVIYLLFVFVSMEWSVFAWNPPGRMMFALLSSAGWIAVACACEKT